MMGVAFDWFRSLPPGSVNSWIDLETRFLSRFYEDDTEVTMDKLLSTVQNDKEGSSVLNSEIEGLESTFFVRICYAQQLQNVLTMLLYSFRITVVA